jgi:biopolymer transport protein ExbB/TolQ
VHARSSRPVKPWKSACSRTLSQRALSFLGTVGSNGPFIGLLGTVIGVILSFAELGKNPKGGLEVVGPGISEALVATAVGLLVAIPAVISFNMFKAALKTRSNNSDFLTRLVIAQLRRSDLGSVRGVDAAAAED